MKLAFTAPNGNQQKILVGERVEITEEIRKQNVARVKIPRSSWNESPAVPSETTEVTLERRNGDLLFGGVVRDVAEREAVNVVTVASFEQVAHTSRPTGKNTEISGTDTEIVTQILQRETLPLTAGIINSVRDGELQFVFSNQSLASVLREVANVTGAHLRYNPDKTVDYVESVGSLRTGSVEISPAQQNIKGRFEIERHGNDKQATHLRVLGAGEGEHQLSTERTPNQPVSRPVWKTVTNKSITDQESLENYADNVYEQYREGTTVSESSEGSHRTIRTTVEGVALNLGDEISVVYPEENVDANFKVRKVTTVIDSTAGTPATYDYEVTLSDRDVRQDDKAYKDAKDIERYNTAFEGVAVPINTGGDRSAVAPGNPYRQKLYFPAEVQQELRLNLRIAGLGFRAFSLGTQSSSQNVLQRRNSKKGSDNVVVSVTNPAVSDIE